jgi:hypothetical protein
MMMTRTRSASNRRVRLRSLSLNLRMRNKKVACIVKKRKRPLREKVHAIEPSHAKAAECCCDEASGGFGSISKDLHRERIAKDIATDGGTRLLYLASPNGEDTAFFAKRLSEEVQLLAVNHGPISLPRDLLHASASGRGGGQRIVVRDNERLEHVLCDLEKNECSHSWLDLTSVDIKIEVLQAAISATSTKVYVVFNASRCPHGFAEMRARMDVRARLFGASIVHEETYVGCGNRRSMMLFVLDVRDKACNVQVDDCIGKAVWTEVKEEDAVVDNYALVRESGRLYYSGRIVSVDHAARSFGVQYYDTHFQLAKMPIRRPAKKHQVSLARMEYAPIVEHFDMKEVKAHMARRRGDA